MANLFDYIKWRGDLDFSVSPLNPVDFMIFSQLSYLPFDGIVPEPGNKNGINLGLAMENLLDILKTSGDPPSLFFKEDPDFIKALLSSARFNGCHLLGYVNQIDTEKELQFSAICVYTGINPVVVYRGTDTSFVGWKEDFNMSFRKVIPAQQEAADYLEKMAPFLKGGLHLTGHSKGGNLAAYAASFCEKKIQKRIISVHSYDAPGFHESIINSDCYNNIKNKIHYYIPQGSIIGMLLEHGSGHKVVKSSQIGLMQHFLFSWETDYNDLVQADKLSISSQFIDKTIREWINSLDNLQREQFVEGVFKILYSSEFKSFQEMETSWISSLGKIIKSMTTIDEPTRKTTLKTFADLFRSAGRNLETFFKRHNGGH